MVIRRAAILCLIVAASAWADVSPRRQGFSPKDLGLARSVPLGFAPITIAVSSDGRWVAIAGRDNNVRVFETSGWKEQRVLEVGAQLDWGLAFSPDGKLLAVGGINGRIRLYETERWTGTEIAAHGDRVVGLAWSPDGKQLASTGSDQCARIWDAASRREVLTLRHELAVTGVAWGAGGRLVTTTTNGLELWDAASGRKDRGVRPGGVFQSAAFSRDGRRFVSVGGEDGTVALWESGTGREVWNVRLPSEGWRKIAFTVDQRFVVVSSGNALALCDGATGELLAELRHHTGVIGGFAIDPHGRWIATVAEDFQLKVWKSMPGGMARVRPKGYLGVQVGDAGGGASILQVFPGTAADRAGLRAGDVIEGVGGTPVTCSATATGVIGTFFVEDEVEFAIRRDGREMKVKARLGARPKE